MKTLLPLQKLQSYDQSDILFLCPMVFWCKIGLQLFTIRSTSCNVHIESTGSIRHPIPFACSLLSLFSTYHTSSFIVVVNSLLSAMFLTWQFAELVISFWFGIRPAVSFDSLLYRTSCLGCLCWQQGNNMLSLIKTVCDRWMSSSVVDT